MEEDSFSINIDVGPQLCPSFQFWPHCVVEFENPAIDHLAAFENFTQMSTI